MTWKRRLRLVWDILLGRMVITKTTYDPRTRTEEGVIYPEYTLVNRKGRKIWGS